MTILWCGGEDIDFTDATTVSGTGGTFRAGYARCSVMSNVGGAARSLALPGGAVSAAWIGGGCGSNPATAAGVGFFGLGNISQNRGLLIGCNSSIGSKLALLKIDGTTVTELGAESGTSIPSTIGRFDMNVSALGASGAVNLYVGGVLQLSYTGDLSWLTNIDCVMVKGRASTALSSELMVADEDTRLFSLVTQAPNAVGDANAWTGAFTDINETTINDATVLYTNTITQNVQFNLIDLPTGVFTIRAVRVAARIAKSASATAGSVSLGVKSGGTVNVDAAHAAATAFATVDRLMTQNPVTSNNWLQSEMNALQVAFRSAT